MNALNKKRDVFLCHTSKDKQPYVYPFIAELKKAGISYWIDEAEIKWGDTITKKVDEGLRISKFVLVFLTENFVGKPWPEAELASALNKENSRGEKVVLPIIIGNKDVIFDRYQLLSGKSCKFWDEGIGILAVELKTILDCSKKESCIIEGIPRSKEILIEEIMSYGAILLSMKEKILTVSDIRYLSYNVFRILMENYGLSIEGDIYDISLIFERELNELSSKRNLFHRKFPRDLSRIKRSVGEIQEMLSKVKPFLNKNPSLPISDNKIFSELNSLVKLILRIITIEEETEKLEIIQLLGQVESVNLEFKSTLRWDLDRKRVNRDLMKIIAKTVSGFMNGEGGTLIIGVDDDGNVIGLKEDLYSLGRKEIRQLRDAYERAFDQLIFNMLGGKAICELIDRKFINYKDKDIFVVKVQKSDKPVFLADKKKVEFYVRIGNSTRPFNTREVVEYYILHFSS